MKMLRLSMMLLPLLASVAQAQVTTDPVGFMQVNIAPGSSGSRALTVLSFPLLNASGITGATAGQISSVTSTTISDSSAAWAAGELSVAATPKIIRITGGNAKGRTFLISSTPANTSTGLTLADTETSDLTTLGIVAGDTYKIYDCQTLSSLFGTPATFAFLGNTASDTADNVLILIDGAWNTFYYNTTNSRWTQKVFGSPNATNQAIKPESAILFNRLGTGALSLVLTGAVPTTYRSDPVQKAGLTCLANNWPTDVTLLASGIQNIPNWKSNASSASADQVLLLIDGAWNTFWWNGTNWRQKVFGNPVSDTQVISAGTGILLSKVATAPADSLLTQGPPY
jgi:hypothetical protein